MSSFDSDMNAILHAVESEMLDLCALGRDSPLFAMSAEHLATGGKRIRARLAVQAASVLGFSSAIVPWAAACELMHNATLVHDDLQDGDRVRRGRPALWAAHGPQQALTAGDFMLMLPFAAIERMRLPPAVRCRLVECTARRAIETARGQSCELALKLHPTPSWEDYLPAAAGKTGQFFALPIEGVALTAGLSAADAAQIGNAFEWVGVAYQILDDVVDLYGHKGRERRGNDLREGKVSALVVEHLARAPHDAPRMMAILDSPRDATSVEDVDWLADRFADAGTVRGVLRRVAAGRSLIEKGLAASAAPELQRLADGVLETIVNSLETGATL